VPPWIRAAAYAVPLCVLPSSLWRLYAVFLKGVLLVLVTVAYHHRRRRTLVLDDDTERSPGRTH